MLKIPVVHASVHTHYAESDVCRSMIFSTPPVQYNPIGIINQLDISFFTKFGLFYMDPSFIISVPYI